MHRATIPVIAGVCVIVFIGYCLYFDKKRREDPNYKKYLKKRRRIQSAIRNTTEEKLFHTKNYEDVRRYFFQEVHASEFLLSEGNMEAGVERLSNAVAVCGQPQRFLKNLQESLPPQAFALLVHKVLQKSARPQVVIPTHV
ncbi:hypothetical protein C0J52_12064 [Blattella germanica]|nr:hypothetical protein C0J52_12064 [Blattella germanica]